MTDITAEQVADLLSALEAKLKSQIDDVTRRQRDFDRLDRETSVARNHADQAQEAIAEVAKQVGHPDTIAAVRRKLTVYLEAKPGNIEDRLQNLSRRMERI